MPAQLSKDLVATLLVESLYTSDDAACARYGVSTKSLQRYRAALPDDPELSGIVATKKAVFDKTWAEGFPIMLRKGIQVLSECMDAIQGDEQKKKDPQIIAAIAGAMKLAADIHLTGKVIDARLADANRQANGLPHEEPADSPTYAN